MGKLILIILLIQCSLLYLGQRRIFGMTSDVFNRGVAYMFSAPGTILHELSHYIACKVLLVPTGRVSLFNPKAQEDGSITLGSVEHARVDPLRNTIVSIAPLLLVPPFLLLISLLLLGKGIMIDPVQAITSASAWKLILWAFITFSAGQGAFPSTGDYIGVAGGIILIAAMVLVVYAVPMNSIISASETLSMILLMPSIASLLSLTFLKALSSRNRKRKGSGNGNGEGGSSFPVNDLDLDNFSLEETINKILSNRKIG